MVDCGKCGNHDAWDCALGCKRGGLSSGALDPLAEIGILRCSDGVYSRSLRGLAASTGINHRTSSWGLELAIKNGDEQKAAKSREWFMRIPWQGLKRYFNRIDELRHSMRDRTQVWRPR